MTGWSCSHQTLNPAQQIVKIVDEELTAIWVQKQQKLSNLQIPTIIMMVRSSRAGKQPLRVDGQQIGQGKHVL